MLSVAFGIVSFKDMSDWDTVLNIALGYRVVHSVLACNVSFGEMRSLDTTLIYRVVRSLLFLQLFKRGNVIPGYRVGVSCWGIALSQFPA